MAKRLTLCMLLLCCCLCIAFSAPGEGMLVAPETIVGFQENTLTVTAPTAGQLTLTLRDSLNSYRSLEAEVIGGANRLTWDGLSQQGERLPTGAYTWDAVLVGTDGSRYTSSVSTEVGRAKQALLFALPSSDTLALTGGEDWFVELALVRAGTVVMEISRADKPAAILLTRRKNIDDTEPAKWKWDGQIRNQSVSPGDYQIHLYAADNRSWDFTLNLRIIARAEQAEVSPTGAVLPEDGATDEEIWALMRQPSVVVDIKNTNHQKVYAQPDSASASLGTLHGQSQCLEVLGIAGDWAHITAWNHERGEQMTGYVPLKVLKVAEPNGLYGLLIDKRTQTMALFENGIRVAEVPISTGLVAKNRLIRETAAGSFLTVERIAGFADGGYYYDYPIRYDGGNLLHQLGYKKVNGRSDFTDQTPLLGQKASHGCVRIQRDAEEETGLCAYWLWTHLPYHTRVMILDDPQQRMVEAQAVLSGQPVPSGKPNAVSAASTPRPETTATHGIHLAASPTPLPGQLEASTALPEVTVSPVLYHPAETLEELLLEDVWEDLPIENTVMEDIPIPAGSAPQALGTGEEELTLTLGGDAVIGTRESWWKRADALPAYLEQYGYAYPFSGLYDIFSADDMTFVNLECVLKAGRDGEKTDKLYRFRGLPSWTAVLTEGSVEQVNIANNHYIDYQAIGKRDTRRSLEAAGIPFSGYEYTHIWEQDGHRIGFAGVRETIWLRDKGIIAREVAELRALGCEVVIYSCHWGVEYSPTHNATQLEMAQAAADAGVDIVVGTHPHVVQGVTQIKGTVVLWSLGNLMFGGTIHLSTYDATLAQVKLRFSSLGYTGCTVQLIPILTSSQAAEGINDFRPAVAEGADKERILGLIQADSEMRIEETMWFPR